MTRYRIACMAADPQLKTSPYLQEQLRRAQLARLDNQIAVAARQAAQWQQCTMCGSRAMPGYRMCLPCAEECGGHGA
jgi:hypothetical protein